MRSPKMEVYFLIGLILASNILNARADVDDFWGKFIPTYRSKALDECLKNATIAEQTFAIELDKVQKQLNDTVEQWAADIETFFQELNKVREQLKTNEETCEAKIESLVNELRKLGIEFTNNRDKCAAAEKKLTMKLEIAQSEVRIRDEQLTAANKSHKTELKMVQEKFSKEKKGLITELENAQNELKQNQEKCASDTKKSTVDVELFQSGNKTKDEKLTQREEKMMAEITKLKKFLKANDYIEKDGFGPYKMMSYPESWPKAREICQKDGAHLAVIDSKEEAQVLYKFTSRREVWIGIHNQNQEGKWVTVFGDPIISENYPWGEAEPNNAYNNEHCGAFISHSKSFYVNDEDCDRKYAYICELS